MTHIPGIMSSIYRQVNLIKLGRISVRSFVCSIGTVYVILLLFYKTEKEYRYYCSPFIYNSLLSSSKLPISPTSQILNCC